MLKKVVISKENTAKALAFLEEINKRKDEVRKKIEKKLIERKLVKS